MLRPAFVPRDNDNNNNEREPTPHEEEVIIAYFLTYWAHHMNSP